jgi:hypothetical protein
MIVPGPLTSSAVRVGGLPAGTTGYAPVRQDPATVETEDVGGLDVPVDPPCLVGAGQHRAQRVQQGTQTRKFGEFRTAVLGCGLGVGHHEPPVVRVGVRHGRGVRVTIEVAAHHDFTAHTGDLRLSGRPASELFESDCCRGRLVRDLYLLSYIPPMGMLPSQPKVPPGGMSEKG